jgi:aconitate decarboxylase
MTPLDIKMIILTLQVRGSLQETWQSDNIRVKSHASMAGTHRTINTVADLQTEYPKQFSNLACIVSIKIEMSEVACKHGGWKVQRPLSALGAQVSCSYVASAQLVDG